MGAFGSLWLFGLNFNVYAFIGVIMLMGMVTKNSILLIDYTNTLVERGQTTADAAFIAAKERFRPIIMTAISTILGMTPIAIGFGAGGSQGTARPFGGSRADLGHLSDPAGDPGGLYRL